MRLLQIRYQDAPEAILLKVLAVQAAALGPVIKGEHPSTGEVHVGMPLMFIEHESNNASESLALLFEPIEKFYEKLGGGSAGVSREIIKSNYETTGEDS